MDIRKDRIQKLRELMKERGIDIYIVPTADYHQSEYVGDYFKVREYLSGFDGSAGTLIITERQCLLWTDGRYFIQAAEQIKESGVTLMKMAMEGVPTIEEFLEENVKAGGCLGFDGKVVNARQGSIWMADIKKKNGTLAASEDLVDIIWDDRPLKAKTKAFSLEQKYSGVSREDKIAKLRKIMDDSNITVHILTSLNDIAWLLNIRGNDIAYNPVVLSYVVVTKEKLLFFAQEEAIDVCLYDELKRSGITICPYEAVYSYAGSLGGEDLVLLDDTTTNYTLYQLFTARCPVLIGTNPTADLKAVKNAVEIENLKSAHIKDAVAMCKFLYWLKSNIGKEKITELDAAAYCEKMRKEDPDCLEMSFSTIAAYGENAAMCHYSPSEKSNKELEPKGLFLVDSGGQYLQGTTDITRTIALGPLTEEEKERYTLVLKGHIQLAMAHFAYGCCGANLDYLARGPLWVRGLDFNHGTGHGVGYLLNVHEGPNNIRWRIGKGAEQNAVLEEGMLTSNEPGYYEEGKYGIRIENLILCKKAQKTNYGQFMEFETVTLVPIDTEAIVTKLLSDEEVEWLNAYHTRVYDTISPLLAGPVSKWLKNAVAPL